MLQSVSPIRDIVHDYVSPSDFEAEIIDSRYFQRLHFVWQNSAVFTVYPCNKNSRFVHSLGVSHLCGRILIHSLRNSNEETFRGFLFQADSFVDGFVNAIGRAGIAVKLEDSWREAIGNRSRFRHNSISNATMQAWRKEVSGGRKITNDPEFTINTLWIALKMAALAHDIGHLPMSHEFEAAIKSLGDAAVYFYPTSESDRIDLEERLKVMIRPNWEECFANVGAIKPSATAEYYGAVLGVEAEDLKNYVETLPLHERRSLRILDEIRVAEGNVNTKVFSEYRMLLFRIATAILLFKRGKLEADESKGIKFKGRTAFLRALKDILASELDADRLDYVARDPKSSGLETGVFDLTRIVNSFTLVETDGNFMAVPGSRALTAIEAFFHQRYLNYKSLIYHKSALRSKAVLRQALMRIVALAVVCPESRIASLCEEYGLVELDKDSGVVKIIPFNERNLEQLDDTRLRSFFFDILNEIQFKKSKIGLNASAKNVLPSIELLLETFLFREKQNLLSLDYSYGRFSSELTIYQSSRVSDCVNAISAEVDSKYGGKVVTLFSSREPKVYNSQTSDASKLQIQKSNSLVPIESLSPYLKFQNQMVKEEARFIVGFCSKGLRQDENLKSELQELAKGHLDRLLEEMIASEPQKGKTERLTQSSDSLPISVESNPVQVDQV